MNAKEFVNTYNVREDVKPAEGNPEWDHPHNGWRVTLKMGRRRMTVPFYSGLAAGEPRAEDVLDCLVSDAFGYLNTRHFEDWANEYDLDSDSRAAERTYRQIGQLTGQLQKFLGDRFDDLKRG